MSNVIQDLMENTHPVISAAFTGFGAYWLLTRFSGLEQQEYVIVVAFSVLAYLAIQWGISDE